MRLLGEAASRLLGDLPPYLQDSPEAQAVEGALGNELARVEAAANRLRLKMLPHAADDEFRTLGMWELLLGLPVEAAGVPLAARQQLALAAFRARHATSGQGWEELVTTALGTAGWTYSENNDYSITILLPRGSTDYSIGAISALVRRVTPAHLDLEVSFTGGFIVGSSATDPGADVVGDSIL